MRNLFLTLATGVALLLTSCENEETLYSSTNFEGGIPVTVEVSVPDGDITRTNLTEVAGNLKWEWSETDKLLVTTTNGAYAGILNLKEITNVEKTNATFEGNLNPSLDNGELTLNFTYIANLADDEELVGVKNYHEVAYATQTGEFDVLKSRDVITTTVTANKTSNYIAIPDFEMTHYLSAGHFELMFKDTDIQLQSVIISGTGLKNKSSLNLSSLDWTDTEGNISIDPAKKDFYITLAPASNLEMHFTAVTTDGKTFEGSMKNDSGETVTFNLPSGRYLRRLIAGADASQDASYVGIPIQMEEKNTEPPAIDDTVGPTFEIDGKKYRFTSGNLYYNTKTGVWSIHDRQTDFTNAGGLDLQNGSGQSPELIGLFSWGATGLEDAQKPTTLREQAWQTSYDGNHFPSVNGSSKNNTIKNLWDNEYVYDWGRAYMENGRAENDKRQYITPSTEIFTALMQSGFVQGATVKNATSDGSDIVGLIVIPNITDLQGAKDLIRSVDGANCLSSMQKVIHNNTGNTLSYKNITLENYEVIKELNNAVFFPAASKRNLTSGSVYNSDGKGWYWSSTSNTSTNGYDLYFDGDKGGFTYNGTASNSSMGRFNQMAVRLLVEVE